MIQLNNLAKAYDRPIFSNFNQQFNENELIVFLGPSGCGKSTLLKMMAGLEQPTSGSITGVSGKKSSVVFQEPRLLPWLSCSENIQLFQSAQGDQSRAQQLMYELGLVDAGRLFPHSLSGGMKMRTAIARALMSNPELLFLDEPFSALDEPTRFFLQEEFRKLFEKNKWSVFFVTHSIEEACFLATRIVIFQKNDKSPLFHSVDLPDIRTGGLRSQIEFFKVVNQVRDIVANAWKQDGKK